MVQLVLLVLVLSVVVLVCVLVGAGAAGLARLDGASWPAAVTRGGAAFAGSLALGLSLLAFLVSTSR